jgi:signal transduction histidine kinase
MSTPATPRPRGRLFRKYVVIIALIVSGALIASGAIEIYFSYLENKAALVAIQREKALGAAARIESFIKEIEHQIGWTTQPLLVAPSAALDQRRFDSLRLLRQVPAITEISHLDAAGREQLRVSRLAMDVVGSKTDFSKDPRFVEARAGRPYYGPVYFRKESEPYMTIAMAGNTPDAGVTVVEVNLKFIWDVVSQIHIGKAGHAYAVDGQGALIAHPDISLVLQKTLFASLPQVQAAIAGSRAAGGPDDDLAIARDFRDRRVLTSYATIVPLRWSVFVEQPLEEAFEPLYASVTRTLLLLALGLALSMVASLLLARRMVDPIRALQQGAARIGAGDLGDRIAVHTGDELEALAHQFNSMATQLQESYAGLEHKVEERTRELSESLEQQTATSEILGVISSSPTDLAPVFDAILENATRLCDAHLGLLGLYDGTHYRHLAHRGASAEYQAYMFGGPHDYDETTGIGRMIRTRQPVHIPDVMDEPAYRSGNPVRMATVALGDTRTFLAVPMLKEGRVVGGIVIYRPEVRPFSDKQIQLVTTFADQAVIAIENVRLFTELRERTKQLARSVEELKALAEVGQAVSATLDVETVLQTIVARASELAGADGCSIWEYDEITEEFQLRASLNLDIEQVRATPVRKGEGVVGRLAETRAPLQVSDIRREGAYEGRLRETLLQSGYRALLAVPLLREEHIIGGLVVNRNTPGEFPAHVIDLLTTFATQSALAIQNARLFREIEDKSRQLEVANRHKSEFLANMSHELRTPLNAIIGFSEVLVERMFGELNEKQDEYLKDIYSSGRHLLSLINDILDLSKVEAGRMELEITTFDLPQAVENALTLVRGRAEMHAIKVEMAVDERLGDFAGDERKFKQILVNLLSNAVKFTPEGGRVTVRARQRDGAVEVSVSDTGIGIAFEDQGVVFEEFRQVGTDYARKREGTGLGLALTKKFVELHGGTIGLTSEVGQGSTFTFTLPVRPWPTNGS